MLFCGSLGKEKSGTEAGDTTPDDHRVAPKSWISFLIVDLDCHDFQLSLINENHVVRSWDTAIKTNGFLILLDKDGKDLAGRSRFGFPRPFVDKISFYLAGSQGLKFVSIFTRRSRHHFLRSDMFGP